MKVYLVKATILICVLIPIVKGADEPCTNAYDETNPIHKNRDDEIMATAHLLCEQAGSELIISNLEIYNELRTKVKYRFCDQFTSSSTAETTESGVCNSSSQFNFPQYGEHFDTFVSSIKEDLNNLIPNKPSNFSSEGLSDDQVKAYQFLCTQIQLEKYTRILSQTDSDSEREKALEDMAKLGLLTHFIHSNEGREFLADPKYPLALRSKAYKMYLENAGSNRSKILSELDNIKYNLQELEGLDDLMDYEKVDLEMSRVAMQAIREYLESPTEKQDTAVIALLVEAKIEGAEEAIARHQAHKETHYPNCSEVSLTGYDKDSYDRIHYIVDEALNEFLNSGNRENFPPKSTYEDRWKWYQSFFSLEDSSDWFQLESRMKYGVNEGRDLLSLRQHYCFYQNLNSDIDRFKELSSKGEDVSSLANEIFTKIHNLDASGEFLSLIKEIYPHLSNEQKITAVQSIKTNVTSSDPNDQERLSQWRLNTLKDWFGPHSEDYSSPLAKEIINAISFKGSIEEEKFLTELFKNARTPEDKQFILTQYSVNTLLEETNGRPEIINAISQESNEGLRNQYLTALGEALSNVQVYGASKGGFATDQIGKVSQERMQGTLERMIALSTNEEVTNSLYKQIYDSIEEAGGVISDTPANNDNLPIAKPADYKGELKPIGNDTTIAGYKTKYFDSNDSVNLGSKRPKKRPSTFSGNTVDYKKLKADQLNSVAQGGSVFDDNQNSFLSSVNQALGFPVQGNQNNFSPPLNPTPQAPIVGESIKEKTSNDSFQSALARSSGFPTNNNFDAPPASTSSSEPSSPSASRRRKNNRRSNQEIIDEIRQISRDTSNLRREIDELNGPTAPLYPAANQVAAAPSNFDGEQNFQQAQGGLGANTSSGTPTRNIASSAQGSSSQRSDTISSNDQGGVNQEKGPNPFSQGLLAPFDDPTKNDLDKIIKITSEEEKILLMNYMAANEAMSCPELRFIEKFYDQNVNKFMMSSSKREYALLELDGMNFRFNYPGTGSLRVKIQEACATLADKPKAKSIGQGSRAPASISAETDENNPEQKELVPTEVKPGTGAQGLMKKFMLKLGL